jgi:hypothetical protein
VAHPLYLNKDIGMIILNTICLILLPFSLLGLFMVFHILRAQKNPADKSNKINKIRLVWFVLTREYLFTDTFPWLKNDELDNVHKDTNK